MKTTPVADAAYELSLNSGNVKEAIASYGTGRVDAPKLAIDDIVVLDGFNVRGRGPSYDAKVREYADSMKANGYFTSKPISVYIARIEGVSVPVVYDGHRRLAAIKLARSEGADFTHIPVITAPLGTSMEDLTASLVTHNSGEQLAPIEVSIVCKRLIGFGKEVAEIARILAISRPYVESLLELSASPASIRDMVTDGKVSATLAIETIKTHGAQSAAKVLIESLGVAQAQGKSKITKKSIEPKVKAPKRDLNAECAEWIATNAAKASAETKSALIGFMCFVTKLSKEDAMALFQTDLAK